MYEQKFELVFYSYMSSYSRLAITDNFYRHYKRVSYFSNPYTYEREIDVFLHIVW